MTSFRWLFLFPSCIAMIKMLFLLYESAVATLTLMQISFLFMFPGPSVLLFRIMSICDICTCAQITYNVLMHQISSTT